MKKELWNIYQTLLQEHKSWYNVMFVIEKMILEECIEELQPQHVSNMARLIGLQRTTLSMKLTKTGVKRPSKF